MGMWGGAQPGAGPRLPVAGLLTSHGDVVLSGTTAGPLSLLLQAIFPHLEVFWGLLLSVLCFFFFFSPGCSVNNLLF